MKLIQVRMFTSIPPVDQMPLKSIVQRRHNQELQVKELPTQIVLFVRYNNSLVQGSQFLSQFLVDLLKDLLKIFFGQPPLTGTHLE